MSKFTNPLNNIKIASPCSADWNAMVGDDRQRFCSDCQLNVYNLSGMSQQEAENLLLNSENRLCVRFYRRADGTILTKDCPVGWRAIKQRISKAATACASLVFAALSGIGLANLTSFENPKTGAVTVSKTTSEIAVPENTYATMGNFTIPTGESYSLSNGGMSNLDAVRTEIGKIRRKR